MKLGDGITPEDLKLFLQEADEQLQLLDEDIIRLEKEAGNPELLQEIFRAAHTLKGSSAMIGHRRMSELAHAMENVFDNVRKGVLSVGPKVVDALLHGLDVMRVLRNELVSPDAVPTEISDAVNELNASMKGEGQAEVQDNNPADILVIDDEVKARIEGARQEGKQVYLIKFELDQESDWASVRCFQIIQELSPMAEILVSLPSQEEIENGNAGTSLELLAASRESQEHLNNVLSTLSGIRSIDIGDYRAEETAAAAARVPGSEAAASHKEETKSSQTVRVDISRLDTLVEQVGELVINRNQINQIGRVLGEKYRDDELINNLNDSVSQIAKIISTLQQDVMSIRLLPLEIVFNTLPRMVRDIARKENKKIDFIIEGQETEVDRSVIEHLRDPLVHLIRNAADHGIETPEERIAAGKPETGTVKLSAFHEQESIIIKLKDDGRGIDPNVLRKTAIKNKVISPEDGAKLSDTEVLNLIFTSGFSTASEITDISGRGVGLDVVKTNIEILSGSVDVESEVGKGTTFTLMVPLTLAIIPALLVATGDTICAIPLSSIVEANKLEEKDVKTVQGREVTLFRGNVLPLLRLDEVFGWATERGMNRDTIYMVVVKFYGAQIGFAVDALLEQQELVVKSLDQFIGGRNGISGASILGDGRVVLILDVASLIRGAIMDRKVGNGERAALSAVSLNI